MEPQNIDSEKMKEKASENEIRGYTDKEKASEHPIHERRRKEFDCENDRKRVCICLKCNKPFSSQNYIYNRICTRCNDLNRSEPREIVLFISKDWGM